ncbi:MAG: sigma-70 family RNA polymerase sigma factor [Planctomycetota bacterium]|nr:sigma-70 family RNA polymerase sigma factor [Planctomycetota bacterium]MDP6503416.1 sigma-70 family RNA polymerase sigma factor [Planctomycetota bacterium]
MPRLSMSEETFPYSADFNQAVSEATDIDLLRKCREGDRQTADDAFAVLVSRYGPRLYRMAYRVLNDRFEAWDICQEAFVRAFTSLDRFDERLSFYTWLYRIGMNLTIDHLRRKKVRKSVALEEPDRFDSLQPPPDKILEDSEQAQEVQRVLGLLPEKYRMILVMRDMEGFAPREIAKIVKVPASLVRWRLHHARKLFKERWLKRKNT